MRDVLEPSLLLGVGGLLAFTAVYALLAVYAERKVSAFIQDRLGPMEVGPKGILQTLADILKLIQKEIILPAAADVRLFLAAPFIVFAAVFAGVAALPFGPDWIGTSLNVGVLFLVAVISIDVVGLLMAGWGANNKYALFGAARAVSQIISYEIPAGLAILAAVAVYGTMHTNEIAMQQSALSTEPIYLFGLWDVSGIGGVTAWGVVRYPHLLVAFVVFFVAALAETNRTPFDIPEAESELVAGFLVEYSGFPFAVLMLAEYAYMLWASALASVLFLGGWNTPFPNLTVGPAADSVAGMLQNFQFAYLTTGTPGTWTAGVWGTFWVLAKSLTLVFVMMWLRWTLPRLRADQLMKVCWKYLTPIALACLLLSAAWKLAEVYANI